MALYVNTNVSSLNANRQLSKSTKALDTSYQRLASGLRINSAKDDAAGLQISDRMTSQINGLNQGNRNAQDGISYAQTAEGAMDEMTNMYQRIRTLALQSANGTNSADDRKAIQQEVDQLCTEIGRIAKDTTFGGENVLSGKKNATLGDGVDASTKATTMAGWFGETTAGTMSDTKKTFQVGADKGQTISIDVGNDALNVDKVLKANGTAATALTSDADKYVDESDDGSGVYTNKILKDVNVQIGDKIYAKADAVTVTYTKDADNSGLGWSVQDVAKSLTTAGKLSDADLDAFHVSKNDAGENILSFDLSSADSAQAVIGCIDKFIGQVDSKRAEYGAVENRLESTMRNQSNIAENLSDARSQIRDTDFATETASMTQTNIIQQASQSILSQANQRPQLALSLMG